MIKQGLIYRVVVSEQHPSGPQSGQEGAAETLMESTADIWVTVNQAAMYPIAAMTSPTDIPLRKLELSSFVVTILVF